MSYNFRLLERKRAASPRAAIDAFAWGIEREAHRVLRDGSLSRGGHPGALAPPSFTTDFAESQLELVTRPWPSSGGALAELGALTAEASRKIGDELLWPFSMPPRLPRDAEIRLARPGSGDAARSAELYRRGLALRYGAARQMICGVHVNVSLRPDFLAVLPRWAPLSQDEAGERTASDGYYLRLARNLVDDLASHVLFFGASPVGGDAHTAPSLSLRNSPAGYARSEYRPFFDLGSLATHAAGIRRGLRSESDAFRRLPLVRGGFPVQLNGKVFQKEKEFYAPVRFRSAPRRGESPLVALERRGVEYLELRFFDVDPFSPSGVSADALSLLHLLLLAALRRPSVPRPNAEWRAILARADEAAMADPIALERDAPLARSAAALLDEAAPIAESLDDRGGSGTYGRVLAEYRRRVEEPRLGTSARLFAEFAASGATWTDFGAATAARNAEGGRNGNA